MNFSLNVNLTFTARTDTLNMDVDDVRRTVANAWAKRFETKKEKETETESAPEKHALDNKSDEPKSKKQKTIPQQYELIELSDEDEVDQDHSESPIEIESHSKDEDTGPVEIVPHIISPSKENNVNKNVSLKTTSKKLQRYPPPLLPIHNPEYDTPKLDNSVVVSDILSSPDLKSCYLFSYQYDLGFILPQFRSKNIDLKIVHQEGTVIDTPSRMLYKNIQLIRVSMQPFTSHHPKLIINFYQNDTCKIYLVSCNMTQMEFETNNQMVWQSPILKKTSYSNNTPFKSHLLDYLKNYENSPLSTLCLMLKPFDFGEVIGDFVSSATSLSDKFGYLGLYKSLLYYGLIPKKYDRDRHLLYQTSSMGSAIRHSSGNNESANIFTHLLLPLFSGKYTKSGRLDLSNDFPLPNGFQSVAQLIQQFKVKPYIIFPSLSDVRNSLFGYTSGGWSHYNPFTKWNIPMNNFLKNHVFHHSYSTQRKTNSSHTKFLIMSSDHFETLDWVFFMSANMSKQAWGTPPKREHILNPKTSISNYETGILLSPNQYGPNIKFIPLEIGEEREMKENEVPIILPFKLPPEQYGSNDEPWCMKKGYAMPDLLGSVHSGE